MLEKCWTGFGKSDHLFEDAVEAAARRGYDAANMGRIAWKWDDVELDKEHPTLRQTYLTIARAAIAPYVAQIDNRRLHENCS